MCVFLLNYDALFKVVKQLFVARAERLGFDETHTHLGDAKMAKPDCAGLVHHVHEAAHNCRRINRFIVEDVSSSREDYHLHHRKDQGWPKVKVGHNKVDNACHASQ